jgi:Histidine kinase
MTTIDLALLKASRDSWMDASRPRVGPYWLQWLWTFVFCAFIAVGFTILGFLLFAGDAAGAWRNLPGWAEWYGRNFVVSLVIGALIQASFDLVGLAIGGRHLVCRWPRWRRTLYYTVVPLACTAVGWPIGISLVGGTLRHFLLDARGQNVIAGTVLFALLLSFLFHLFFALKARQLEAEKRATEAQLRLLQGQIEPHFLFNTLAGVISLIDPEPAKAKQMLQDFTEYLRSSLSVMRTGDGPLAQELDLAEHYLRLLGSRMEDRLHWHIDADEAARRVPVPPLLLQPLVENAIHHGLEPTLDGGSVTVSATVQGSELLLTVTDDGRGLHAPPRPGARSGNGMALANIRSRLQAHYGNRARLDIEASSSGTRPGTRAVIRLPIERSPA